MEFSTTKRGNPMLIFNGYMYTKQIDKKHAPCHGPWYAHCHVLALVCTVSRDVGWPWYAPCHVMSVGTHRVTLHPLLRFSSLIGWNVGHMHAV